MKKGREGEKRTHDEIRRRLILGASRLADVLLRDAVREFSEDELLRLAVDLEDTDCGRGRVSDRRKELRRNKGREGREEGTYGQ